MFRLQYIDTKMIKIRKSGINESRAIEKSEAIPPWRSPKGEPSDLSHF